MQKNWLIVKMNRVNIRDFLNQSTDREVLLFTDDSALGNPEPTGAGSVAYVHG